MSNYRVKNIGVLSVAKIGAVLGLIFGAIEGIIMALVVSNMGFLAKSVFPMAGLGAGVIFIVMMIGGAIGGFIGGAIGAFIYNIAAGVVGPVEVDLEV